MRYVPRARSILTLLVLLAPSAPVRADEPPDFERDIRPLLERHCIDCHGAEEQEGSLQLDSKSSVLRGGNSGEPAVVPGSSGRSRLIKLVTSADPKERMPRKGEPLKPEEIALLRRWIDTGAHWLTPDGAGASAETDVEDAEPQLSEKDRSFWSFVPPKRVEPPAVTNAGWPRARIDRFILARLEAKGLRPSSEAPRQALVRRLSYDLTGLPPTPEEVAAFVYDNRPDAYERLVDRLLASPAFGEHLASLWLPLARYAEDQAHQVGSDTKFFYPNAWRYRQWVVDAFNRDLPYDRFVQLQLAADKLPDAAPDDLAALGFIGLGPKYYGRGKIDVQADEWEDRVDTVTRTTLGLTVACARCHDHKFDPIPTSDYYALAGVFASTRLVNKVPGGETQKGELEAPKVDPKAVHAVEDGEVKDLNVFLRGNPERKGRVVPRRFLSVLSPPQPAAFTEGSGRKELALAIADEGNPLTARVMVNRVWGSFFGKPLVTTPSNFGRTGEPPSHPDLLDDLAVRFMEGGWSVKSLVREIVLSSTYRQTSRDEAGTAGADPANLLLGRMNRRRLTVEQWRDTVLFASANLQPTPTGPSLELDDPANLRRTLYARVSRLKLNDVLMQFDYPDANVHAERRSVTSTPAQKLFLINSPFMLAQAKALANRLLIDAPRSDEDRVVRAYELLFARQPNAEELSLALEFLGQPDSSAMSRWEQYAQVLLVSNEAMYVD